MAANPTTEPTRERVLQVALELIADKGYAATTTREVCERMGFTKAALYYWFRTKEDLLAAVTAPLLEDLGALVHSTAISPNYRARRSILVRYADLVMRHADMMRVLGNDPSLQRMPCLTVSSGLYEQLEKRLSGQEVPGIEARARVRSAVSGLHAALLRPAPGDDPLEVRRFALAAACGALAMPAPASLLRIPTTAS